ncbi:MAG: 3-dehydroquinate synthase [Thermoanaerobaculia bacterium]
MIEPSVSVRQASASYPVFIRHGIMADLEAIVRRCSRAQAVVVVTSETVARLAPSKLGFANDPILVPEGEAAKSFDVAYRVISAMLDRGLKRDTVLVAVGGGSIGDLAGFVASVFLRGIDLVHVPTTLLSMLDSSIGGKNGVNHPSGKNLIGTIWPPRAVVIDLDFIATLPAREVRSGLFEALKCGVISDPMLFSLVANRNESDPLGEVVKRAIAVKAAVVEHDERDTERRRLLNYGHTIGHGLEAAFGFSGLTHGEAVGWGMLGANAVAARLGVTGEDVTRSIDGAIRKLGLPALTDLDPENILEAIEHDKKFSGARRVMVLPRAIGNCEVVRVQRSDIEFGVRAIFDRRALSS